MPLITPLTLRTTVMPRTICFCFVLRVSCVVDRIAILYAATGTHSFCPLNCRSALCILSMQRLLPIPELRIYSRQVFTSEPCAYASYTDNLFPVNTPTQLAAEERARLEEMQLDDFIAMPEPIPADKYIKEKMAAEVTNCLCQLRYWMCLCVRRVFCAGQRACKWAGREIIICYVFLRLPPIVYLLAASLLFLCLLCLV
jgi:hypothetical protein